MSMPPEVWPMAIMPGQYLWLLRLLKGEAVNHRRQAHSLILEHFGVSTLDEVTSDQASAWILELCRKRKSLG